MQPVLKTVLAAMVSIGICACSSSSKNGGSTSSGATAKDDAAYQQKKAALMTRWAKDVTPSKAHTEYPRPTMVRKDWQNLNGMWDYAITPKDAPQPTSWQGKILVPFPIESALSGVMKPVGKDNRLWYRRTFTAPKTEKNGRVLLHFGAVDWDSTVIVNGKEVAKHRGGYDPFSADITDALKPSGEQEIILSVYDPTTDSFQPIGKQHARPHGIWYTPTTGIWQTAWLEPVPAASIASLKMTPDLNGSMLRLSVSTRGQSDNIEIVATARDGKKVIETAAGNTKDPLILKIPTPKLWTPESPFLYDLTVELKQNGKPVDQVESYFGMRKISLGKDDKGITRLFLNNKPLFQYGPLDQGFWPDGLYTAPTDEALRYDIEITKQLGFNMARKHVKVEPERWYYHCDKLGLLVWQDMPSGEKHVARGRGEITRTKESAENFERELKAMMDARHNHPSIVIWVPFNEGWGQYDTVRITNWVKQYDPSRLAIGASGWNDYPAGDAHDIHVYPGPGMPKLESDRAAVLGEFGGLGLPLENHTWQARGNWGYRSFTTKEALTEAYLGLMTRLRPLIGQGLAAAVYTQTTDVEIEVNGLLTYDRAVMKIEPKVLTEAHRKLWTTPPTVKMVVQTSQTTPHQWQYTTEKPADAWFKPDFDASSWKTGPAGFGTASTPGATIGTAWNTPEIWIRRTFELPEGTLADPHLLIHHDEDATVYINGEEAAKAIGFTSDYTVLGISSKAAATLKPGKNTIAIHCKQTRGGQYIDAGLVDIIEQK